jgi:WD40 repeat protein
MLDLTNDYFRFVTGYFEVINTSAPHIYHSALISAPQKSIIRRLYESHAHPFMRIVHGVPMSWDSNTAATTCHSTINLAVWSPCNRFIAIALGSTRTMDILDSVTLQRLQTLESPPGISTGNRALIFSPDSHILTCSSGGYRGGSDRELFVVSWDLQTGGVASIIRWRGPEQHVVGEPSITYSADGKMVGVFYWHPQRASAPGIFICDIASGTYMHSHSLNGATPLSNKIWTHGEYLRFATANATTITIWEVRFVSGSTPMEVETLPVDPTMFPHIEHMGQIQLHTPPCQDLLTSPCQLPTRLCQLLVAITFEDNVLVWDARKSRCLLHCADTSFRPRMSFSSDGHFFACSTSGPEIYLWKESSTGYILHDILAPRATYPNPLLSQKGESIVAFSGHMIWLWRINSSTTRPSGIPTQAPQLIENFILDFSPDGMLAIFAMRKNNMVTILDLKSGVPQLQIDTGMEVYGLRVVGKIITVIGDRTVATWNLPAEGVRVGDRVSITPLGGSQWGDVTSASMCPDSRHIALTKADVSGLRRLYVYNAHTGDYLGYKFTGGDIPWFAPGGRDIWCVADSSETEVWGVGGERNALEAQGDKVDVENPPEGYPWGSSHGYQVTGDWWILSSDGKRLFMLPPPWQSHAVRRIWNGRFLVLLHGGLSEPVILELEL